MYASEDVMHAVMHAIRRARSDKWLQIGDTLRPPGKAAFDVSV